ncbi:MAG: hypothetical protein Kow0031_25250 [Anaerolineae bacterium]
MLRSLIGTRLGPYHIESLINQGKMGVVFKAVHPKLEREVAVKVLRPDLVSLDSRFRKRFEREAQLVARLNHPHIVPVYDYGIDRDFSYIVMRYIAGGQTLKRYLRLTANEAEGLTYIGHIAQALDYAHRQGVVHRDVKPDNVLMDGELAMLTDFGLARLNEGNWTQTGSSILGTPLYMSPEQIKPDLTVDHRADIYALGVIVYQMFTGQVPHYSENGWLATAVHRSQSMPQPLTALNPALPSVLNEVVLTALALDPAARYDSAGAFYQALVEAAGTDLPPAVAVLPAPGEFDADRLADTWVSPPAQRQRPAAYLLWSTLAALLLALLLAIPSAGHLFGPAMTLAPPAPTAGSTSSTAAMAVAASPTASPPATLPSRTPAVTPVAIEFAAGLSPTVTATGTPLPTATPPATSRPTRTATPAATPVATATPTSTLVATFTPAAPATFTATPVSTGAALPPGSFRLVQPVSFDQPTYGPTLFEWEWVGEIPADYGFEVRLWRAGEPPAGVHNAVLDNAQGVIRQVAPHRYQLAADVTHTPGVLNRRGEYWWTVALVRVQPAYDDLALRVAATPAALRFEPIVNQEDAGGDNPDSLPPNRVIIK